MVTDWLILIVSLKLFWSLDQVYADVTNKLDFIKDEKSDKPTDKQSFYHWTWITADRKSVQTLFMPKLIISFDNCFAKLALLRFLPFFHSRTTLMTKFILSFWRWRNNIMPCLHLLWFWLIFLGIVFACDSGWVARPGSNSCYKFVTTRKATWQHGVRRKGCDGIWNLD